MSSKQIECRKLIRDNSSSVTTEHRKWIQDNQRQLRQAFQEYRQQHPNADFTNFCLQRARQAR